MKRILLFLAIISSNLIFSQASIRGTVTDDNGEVLVGATVQLTKSKGQLVDVDGKFIFDEIQPGSYSLTASFLGYMEQTKEVTVGEGEQVRVDFIMSLSKENLQEVEIVGRRARTYKNELTFAATKTATAIKDIPQAVSYVTKEVIADQQVPGE